jgi:calcineurin-like phosphoesterase family protein
MSKIFIIANTNFGISKNLSSKEWQKNMNSYFELEFIPYLTNNVRPNDILIHLGNFLYKTKVIDLNTLKFVQNLFEKIAEIVPVYIIQGENDSLGLNILKNFKNIEIIREAREIELLVDQRFAMIPYDTKIEDIDTFESDYCFFNLDYLNSPKKDIIVSKFKKFKKCYNGYYDKNGVTSNIKNLAAPYNIEGDDKKGFIVLDTLTNKDKFIQNKLSPNFKKIYITNESELNIPAETFMNNHVSLNINKKILLDNKLKIEMLINQYDIINVTYSDDEILKDKEEILELNQTSLSLNEMVIDYINQSQSQNKNRILEEFKNIVKLNKK